MVSEGKSQIYYCEDKQTGGRIGPVDIDEFCMQMVLDLGSQEQQYDNPLCFWHTLFVVALVSAIHVHMVDWMTILSFEILDE